MEKYESKVKTIYSSDKEVFNTLADLKNFDRLAAFEKVRNWHSTNDTCICTIDGIGEIGMRIMEKQEHKLIKFSGEGKIPFQFYIWIQLKQVSENTTKMRITIGAELSSMLKMFAKKPLMEFVNSLAEQIAYSFNNQYAQMN